MPISYTNRKGVTYQLCRGLTSTGKPRYYFAQECKGDLVDEIPEGFRISESVNGIVSLVRDRPSPILPEELAAVEAAVKRHPRSGDYRVTVKGNRIEIHERAGPDVDRVIAMFRGPGTPTREAREAVQSALGRFDRFDPVLRFTLENRESRTFHAERMCYLGSVDDFIPIGEAGSAEELARELVPKLGTEALFDLLY